MTFRPAASHKSVFTTDTPIQDVTTVRQQNEEDIKWLLRARDWAAVLEVSINITQQECDTSPTRADKPQAVRTTTPHRRGRSATSETSGVMA